MYRIFPACRDIVNASRSVRRGLGNAVLIACCVAFPVLAAGCSLGFTNLHPGDADPVYGEFFADIITSYDEPHWLWIRGTIEGDFNGDGNRKEEAVLATIQKGDARSPGPIEAAFLLICTTDESGIKSPVARTLLFDNSPIPGAPQPINDLRLSNNPPLIHAKAQIVQEKVGFSESIVVYFWGAETPGSVWYAGYSLKNGFLERNLEVAFWQSTPGFLSTNLDKRLEAAEQGYQLLFGIAAIPRNVSEKLGAVSEMPLWGHVYSRGKDGVYRQADENFGDNFRRLESSWNQMYLKAMLQGLPKEDLAWFEYHMGIMNHYTGNPDMSRQFLEKAEANAADDTLRSGARQALRELHNIAGE